MAKNKQKSIFTFYFSTFQNLCFPTFTSVKKLNQYLNLRHICLFPTGHLEMEPVSLSWCLSVGLSRCKKLTALTFLLEQKQKDPFLQWKKTILSFLSFAVFKQAWYILGHRARCWTHINKSQSLPCLLLLNEDLCFCAKVKNFRMDHRGLNNSPHLHPARSPTDHSGPSDSCVFRQWRRRRATRAAGSSLQVSAWRALAAGGKDETRVRSRHHSCFPHASFTAHLQVFGIISGVAVATTVDGGPSHGPLLLLRKSKCCVCLKHISLGGCWTVYWREEWQTCLRILNRRRQASQ